VLYSLLSTLVANEPLERSSANVALAISGPAAWNGLPPHLRTITDTNIFKRRLKSFCSLTHSHSVLALLNKLYSSALLITDCTSAHCDCEYSTMEGRCRRTV